MANGSYITDSDEVLLASLLENKTGGAATKVSERFRSEVGRADANSQTITELKAEIRGMSRVIRIQAGRE